MSKLLRSFWRLSSGMTLVEVLVVIAIMGIGLFFLMQTFNVTLKSQKGVEHANELTQYQLTLTQLFLPQDVCRMNLKNFTFDPADLANLQGSPGLKVYFPRSGATPGSIEQGAVFSETGKTVGGWTTTALGVRVLGPTGFGYLLSVEARFSKRTDTQGNPISLGNNSGTRQTTTITVTTTASGSRQQVVDCDSGNSVPSGSVMAFAGGSCPTGWLLANGQSLEKAAHATLFNAIGTTFGSTATHFSLPDLRGEFIRGLDSGRNVDAGRTLGSAQNGSRLLLYWWRASGAWAYSMTDFGTRYSDVESVTTTTSGGSGAVNRNVTDVAAIRTGIVRPRNVALLYCIKK